MRKCRRYSSSKGTMVCYSGFPVFLLFLLRSVSVASVPPPMNVTLRCHNLRNILQWDYDNLLPGIRFKVNIQPYVGQRQVVMVDPPEQQADISFLKEPNNQYFVDVTAVVGENESEGAPAEGLTFSYNQDSLTNQICSLDLPPVNATMQPNGHIKLSFVHPWLLYHQPMEDGPKPKRHKKSNNAQAVKELPEFKYDVLVVEAQKKEPKTHCRRDVCQREVPVDNVQEKHCVNITGELKNMAVKSTRLYCAEPLGPPEPNIYVYVVIGALVFAVLLLLIFFVYKKKTRASSPLPKAMSITSSRTPAPVQPTQETWNVVTPEPSSPTPLLPLDNEFPTTDITIDQPVFRERIGLGKNIVEEEPLNDDTDAYMGGQHMEDEDRIHSSSASSSGYETRPVVVDLGNDELAEGYRVRNP